jgi:ribosomal protein S18 acetylase RimI-like enzyme
VPGEYLDITARRAGPADADILLALYGEMAAEQIELKPVWALADGLPEPLEPSIGGWLAGGDVTAYLGSIDGVALGFLVTASRPLLPQAGPERIGTIEYVFTHPEARGVGLGEAMITLALADLRAAGHTKFDASALPGHRLAKNFFESNGFSARRIIMHHDDDR